jgi:thioesterase domain-containing protein
MTLEIIRRQLDLSVPFARWLGIEILALDGQQALTRLVARPPLLNHVGTMHGGALFTVCEAASGAAVVGALADVVLHTRCVVKDAQVDYLAPARGDVSARARLVDDSPVLEILSRDGRAEVAVDVSATARDSDGTDTLIARASFTWHLRFQASPPRSPDRAADAGSQPQMFPHP